MHGGNLMVDNCLVRSPRIIDSEYSFFLYQVDGEATITNSQFSIADTFNQDVMFGASLFMIGETAIVNGKNHEEWSNNNQTDFLTIPYNNQSIVNLTYYYDLIEANIHLQSSNGYCHSCSGLDYVFKNNVNVSRSQ